MAHFLRVLVSPPNPKPVKLFRFSVWESIKNEDDVTDCCHKGIILLCMQQRSAPGRECLPSPGSPGRDWIPGLNSRESGGGHAGAGRGPCGSLAHNLLTRVGTAGTKVLLAGSQVGLIMLPGTWKIPHIPAFFSKFQL